MKAEKLVKSVNPFTGKLKTFLEGIFHVEICTIFL